LQLDFHSLDRLGVPFVALLYEFSEILLGATRDFNASRRRHRNDIWVMQGTHDILFRRSTMGCGVPSGAGRAKDNGAVNSYEAET